MGQRLVIDIKKDGRTLGNCYYHWEGFTLSALNRAKSIIDNYNKYLTKVDDNMLLLIRLFQEQNIDAKDRLKVACIEKNSKELLKKNYPSLDICGNSEEDETIGRIAVSEADMQNNLDNGEGFLTIDFDNNTIILDKLFSYWDIDEYCEVNGCKEEDLDIDICPRELNLGNLKFNQIEDATTFVSQNSWGWYDYFRDDIIVTVIE